MGSLGCLESAPPPVESQGGESRNSKHHVIPHEQPLVKTNPTRMNWKSGRQPQQDQQPHQESPITSPISCINPINKTFQGFCEHENLTFRTKASSPRCIDLDSTVRGFTFQFQLLFHSHYIASRRPTNPQIEHPRRSVFQASTADSCRLQE